MSDGLATMYRMPVSFGPAPGPRNLPEEHRHRRYQKKATSLTLSARTDPVLLANMLPDGFELTAEPRIEVALSMFEDIGWLAGRGYNILLVRIPACWRGEEDMTGCFVPVVWESMADPILTGRDELGWAKIFADVSNLREAGGEWRASAAWDGFKFFEMAASGFEVAEASPPTPMMFRKYVPRTGRPGEADIDYPTVTAPDGPAPEIRSAMRGTGCFAFHTARWEDMPTQYPIVNALASLPLHDFGTATLVETTGGGDGSGQRRLS